MVLYCRRISNHRGTNYELVRLGILAVIRNEITLHARVSKLIRAWQTVAVGIGNLMKILQVAFRLSTTVPWLRAQMHWETVEIYSIKLFDGLCKDLYRQGEVLVGSVWYQFLAEYNAIVLARRFLQGQFCNNAHL